MPTKIPKQRKVLRTITMSNGSTITGEEGNINGDSDIYWFRDGKYITPEQQKHYKYYDKETGIYRSLDKQLRVKEDRVYYTPYNPVVTPNIDTLQNRAFNKSYPKIEQFIPTKTKKVITLRTKGKMNLADITENMLDSIAVNSGRSDTDFFTNAALIGKESTFGGYSRYLHDGEDISASDLYFDPYALTNNHAYFIAPEYDYLRALSKKYDLTNETDKIKAEKDVEYAIKHNLIKKYNSTLFSICFSRRL